MFLVAIITSACSSHLATVEPSPVLPDAGQQSIVNGEGTWVQVASMPTARLYLAVGVINGIVYAVGGWNFRNVLATVEAYNPLTNVWTEETPMPTPRQWLCVRTVNGILYAIGGADAGGFAVDNVEAYNPATNSWTEEAPLPEPRSSLACGVVNGKIYAVGGEGGRNGTQANEMYDPITNTWTEKAAMPTGRAFLGVGVVRNILYAVGGSWQDQNTERVVEAYDPKTDSWAEKNPLHYSDWGMGTGVINDKMYLVGGFTGPIMPERIHAQNEIYNPATDASGLKAPMPMSIAFLGAGVVNGVLYAVGGEDRENQNYNNINRVYAYTP